MRFSIITITFNAEKYLHHTLQSVAEQDFTDYEHLVWDGGSSDCTLEIARSFPHVKIYQGRDSGISDAMNKGAELAQGEFLLHLHADDYLFDRQALSVVHTALKQHPQAEWLHGGCAVVNEAGVVMQEGKWELFNRKKLKKYNTIAHPATFYSKKLFMKMGGFRTDLRYAMDYELWLRFSQVAHPYTLAKTLSCFRSHSGSVSTANERKVADEAYFVRSLYLTSLLDRWRSYRTWKRRLKIHRH